MAFKDLKKRIISNNQQQTQSFDKLQDKPFWIWDQQQHRLEDVKITGYCCFNHIIGRTVVENDGVLDKEATSYDDVFDAFRLAMHFYRLSQYY